MPIEIDDNIKCYLFDRIRAEFKKHVEEEKVNDVGRGYKLFPSDFNKTLATLLDVELGGKEENA